MSDKEWLVDGLKTGGNGIMTTVSLNLGEGISHEGLIVYFKGNKKRHNKIWSESSQWLLNNC